MEEYLRIFYACDYAQYQQVHRAMAGLRATEAETTFDNAVYFYLLIHQDDLEAFHRKMEEMGDRTQG